MPTPCGHVEIDIVKTETQLIFPTGLDNCQMVSNFIEGAIFEIREGRLLFKGTDVGTIDETVIRISLKNTIDDYSEILELEWYGDDLVYRNTITLGDDSDDATIKATLTKKATGAMAMPLRGLWQTRCYEANGSYHVLEIEIHEDVWTTTDWTYADSRCRSVPVLEFQTLREVRLEGTELNATVKMAYLRPYTNDLAAKFNQKNLCEVHNWKRGRIIEVTGHACEGLEEIAHDQKIFSIFKAEGPKNNILYLGAPDTEHDGTSSEKRHTDYFSEVLIRDPSYEN